MRQARRQRGWRVLQEAETTASSSFDEGGAGRAAECHRPSSSFYEVTRRAADSHHPSSLFDRAPRRVVQAALSNPPPPSPPPYVDGAQRPAPVHPASSNTANRPSPLRTNDDPTNTNESQGRPPSHPPLCHVEQRWASSVAPPAPIAHLPSRSAASNDVGHSCPGHHPSPSPLCQSNGIELGG
ncbi:hypothetical protein B0H34DRAFT_58738 [Crassisporium funariophilum]|nr:hypothetical protein B0H34DRAFT_58738 [Crassisporium funariophilum]